jgi:polyisoprenoid-binding protein YceI
MIYTIDKSHSEIGFRVKHLGISSVSGVFKNYEAHVEGDSLEDLLITFSADINSIDTKDANRDTHLISADLFDHEVYPKILFSAKSVNLNSGKITGELTIKGVTKLVEFDLIYNHGATISGNIKRSDFGLTYNLLLETGGWLIGDEVTIQVDLELHEN